MERPDYKCLLIACGAIAKEILALKKSIGIGDDVFKLQCLPAAYHNTPEKIVPALEKIIEAESDSYKRILIGYGDCGTGGALDRMMEKHPKTERLPGTHCYAFFMGLAEFDAVMEEELGTFFLTDYLARHFETLIVKGFGIDRYPDLKDMYFEHYKRLIYISQAPTDELIEKAQKAAEFLNLEFEHKEVGYGCLERDLAELSTQRQEGANV